MINLRSSLFIVALAVGGCQKAPDVDKMQSQALLTVKSYAGGLETLQRRADTLLTKYRTMEPNLPGAAEASRRLGDARSELEELRAFANGVPGMFAAAAKKSPDELQEAIDTTDAKLVEGTVKITGDLTAFENWSAFARPVAMATPPAPPAAPTEPAGTPTGTPPEPAPEREGEHPPGTPKPADGGAAKAPTTPPAAAPTPAPAKPGAPTPAKPAAPTPAPAPAKPAAPTPR